MAITPSELPCPVPARGSGPPHGHAPRSTPTTRVGPPRTAPARPGIFHEPVGPPRHVAHAPRARLWRQEAVANGRAARGRDGQWEAGEGLSRPMEGVEEGGSSARGGV